MKLARLNWHSKNYDDKRATGDRLFRKRRFLGYIDGKKHYSIGRGSIYFNQLPPNDEIWDYEWSIKGVNKYEQH